MLGCCRLAATRISRRNRSAPSETDSSGRSTLMATLRSCFRSSAPGRRWPCRPGRPGARRRTAPPGRSAAGRADRSPGSLRRRQGIERGAKRRGYAGAPGRDRVTPPCTAASASRMAAAVCQRSSGVLASARPMPGRQLRRDLRPDRPHVRRRLGEMHLQHHRLVPVHERRLARPGTRTARRRGSRGRSEGRSPAGR